MNQFNLFGIKFAFGRSTTKMAVETKVKERLTDIIVAPEATTQVQQLIAFLKSPDDFEHHIKGIFVVAAPGTVEALFVKVLSGEARVPLFRISAPDFVEPDLSIGGMRIRKLFDQARKLAPCVIFIDNIDALFTIMRGSGEESQQGARKQLLSEMDNSKNSGMIIAGSIADPDHMNQDFTRPGRFSQGFRIELNSPTSSDEPGKCIVHLWQ